MRQPSFRWLVSAVAAVVLLTTTTGAAEANSSSARTAARPTIVLVHGAFADSSSWSREILALQASGYTTVAVANPLRGVAGDAAYVDSVLKTIPGPVVLVGHSYAGMLIGQAAATSPNVKALVYVAAYIPVVGESASDLTYKDPGSLLVPPNLVTRTEPGGTDIYISPTTFGRVYAGGLSRAETDIAAVAQRPIAASALSDPETVATPTAIPKWEIVALDDNAIPTTTQSFMAARAKARVVTTHSGHDVPAAQPKVVTGVILDAARSVH